MLIEIFVVLLVIALVLWLLQQLPLPAPFGFVLQVLLVLIVIVWLVSFLPHANGFFR